MKNETFPYSIYKYLFYIYEFGIIDIKWTFMEGAIATSIFIQHLRRLICTSPFVRAKNSNNKKFIFYKNKCRFN